MKKMKTMVIMILVVLSVITTVGMVNANIELAKTQQLLKEQGDSLRESEAMRLHYSDLLTDERSKVDTLSEEKEELEYKLDEVYSWVDIYKTEKLGELQQFRPTSTSK